jgi:Uma2 family endonuclease
MSQPAFKDASYEDLLAVPRNLVAEILDGQIHTHPRPASRHARASSVLGGRIGGPFDFGAGGPGGWWIIDEPELHLGSQVMAPDLAGWRRERMPDYPDAPWFGLSPDWVCEILSPSTAETDRHIKMPLYARHGVQYLWLVDPVPQTLQGYQLRDGRWRLLAKVEHDAPVQMAPFDAVAFPLSALWS